MARTVRLIPVVLEAILEVQKRFQVPPAAGHLFGFVFLSTRQFDTLLVLVEQEDICTYGADRSLDPGLCWKRFRKYRNASRSAPANFSVLHFRWM